MAWKVEHTETPLISLIRVTSRLSLMALRSIALCCCDTKEEIN